MFEVNFFAGVDLYRTNHEYGTATTEDLQAAMEAVSGLDLTDFQRNPVDDHGDPPAEWPGLGPGMRGPRNPEASPGRDGREIHMPHVTGARGVTHQKGS